MDIDLGQNPVSSYNGSAHRIVSVTVDGRAFTVLICKDDAKREPRDKEDAVRRRILSALKEAGTGSSLAAWNALLSGKEYKV